jgi:hypothetical protein
VIDSNEKIVKVEIVFQEHLVHQILKGARRERLKRNGNARRVPGNEVKDFGSDVEVAEN